MLCFQGVHCVHLIHTLQKSKKINHLIVRTIKIKNMWALNYICKDQRVQDENHGKVVCVRANCLGRNTQFPFQVIFCYYWCEHEKILLFFFVCFWLERWAELLPSCPWWRNSVQNLQLPQRDNAEVLQHNVTVSRSMWLLCDKIKKKT